MDKKQAQEALAAMEHARGGVADMGKCPLWRHAAFGTAMGLVVMGQGVDTPAKWYLYLAGAVVAVAIFLYDRHKYGMFINGYRRGTTLIVSLSILAIMLAVMATEVWLWQSGAELRPRIMLAVVSALAASWGSVLWNRIFMKEMRERSI